MFSATAFIEPDPVATWFDSSDCESLGQRFARFVSNTAEKFPTSEGQGAAGTTYYVDPGSMAVLADEGSKQEIESLLDQLQKCCAPELGISLVNRLRFLRQALEEEEGTPSDISPDSLRGLLLFVRCVERFRQPEISLTPEHEVYLRWKIDTSNLFAVHFLGHKNVRFVVFAPNHRHPGFVNRLSGTATVDTVLGFARRGGIDLDWIQP